MVIILNFRDLLFKKLTNTFILLVLVLVSCTPVDDAERALRDIRTSNMDSRYFPWTFGMAHGRTKRWDIEHDGLIPVKLNGSTLAGQAIAEIESTLGMPLFETTSIADLEDSLIARGIIVSEGTAIGPRGKVDRNTCGHVAAGPDTTAYPQHFYEADGRINTRLYVNLSSAACTASLEIAIHEFGHALGLGKHFFGFGSGEVIAASFWQALYVLYTNEVGMPAEDLKIELLDPALFDISGGRGTKLDDRFTIKEE